MANDCKFTPYDEFLSTTQWKCVTEMLSIGDHQHLKFGRKHRHGWMTLVTKN